MRYAARSGANRGKLAGVAALLTLASCGLTERSSSSSSAPTPTTGAATHGMGGEQTGDGDSGGGGGDDAPASWQVAAELPESEANVSNFATGDISLHDGTAALADAESHAVRVFAQTATGGDWVEERLVLGSDTLGQDFGASVSVFEDTLLVGAPKDGVGSVYVFERKRGAWAEADRFRPSAGSEGGGFGAMVALSGATALVADWNGAAYSFTRAGGEWVEEQQLTPSDTGRVVTLDGDTAVVGERNRNGVSAATVFVRGASGWEQTQRLVPDVVDRAYESDMALALSGDTLLIGTRYDRDFAGAVHVFSRDADEWREEQLLVPHDGDEYFGRDVAIHRDVALAVSWHPGNYSGSVYVFERTSTSERASEWSRVQELVSPRGGLDAFGASISLFGDMALIAAPGQGNLEYWAGSAYLFTRLTER